MRTDYDKVSGSDGDRQMKKMTITLRIEYENNGNEEESDSITVDQTAPHSKYTTEEERYNNKHGMRINELM